MKSKSFIKVGTAGLSLSPVAFCRTTAQQQKEEEEEERKKKKSKERRKE